MMADLVWMVPAWEVAEWRLEEGMCEFIYALQPEEFIQPAHCRPGVSRIEPQVPLTKIEVEDDIEVGRTARWCCQLRRRVQCHKSSGDLCFAWRHRLKLVEREQWIGDVSLSHHEIGADLQCQHAVETRCDCELSLLRSEPDQVKTTRTHHRTPVDPRAWTTSWVDFYRRA